MTSNVRQVAAEVAARLQSRGIDVSASERPEDLADLLTVVEQFEAAVEARGGDLMVDDLKSSQPDDIHFVLPPRQTGEALRSYIARVNVAAAQVRGHPNISA